MSYRFMRVVVFFDLPTVTESDKKEYRAFRKHLIKSGFMMMQESVYVKLVPNNFAEQLLIENIRKHKPSSGLVQVLKVTEKQYASIENIIGTPHAEVIDSDERLIIL